MVDGRRRTRAKAWRPYIGVVGGLWRRRPAPEAYDWTALQDRSYTAAEVDAALARLVEPGRLAHAQDVVVHAAPALQRVLAEALAEGGWFGEAHDAEVSRIAGEHDEHRRATALSTLVAEQTRVGMFVGVAVGFELARELALVGESSEGESGGWESQENQPTTEEH